MRTLAFFLFALALAGCVSAPDNATQSAAASVEILKDGPPSRPYQVIDTVQRLGADGSATYAQLEDSIAQEAARRGADAVLIQDTVMVVSRMDPTTSRPIMAPKVDAQLIKYQ